MTATADNLVLPALRPDLELHRGPDELDGSPTWNLHDPLTGIYRKIGWAEAEVLKRLRGRRTLKQLMDSLARETTLDLCPEDVAELCRQAASNRMTVSSGFADPRQLEAAHRAAHPHPLAWLLQHYLFIRIPLIRPDYFLRRTLPLVRPLASGVAVTLYVCLFVLGCVLLLPRLDAYLRTFPYWFTREGVLAYIAVIVLLKAVHEFSHAYAAAAYGVRVPTMGVALMVFVPVAFCDVTDGWKLQDRRARLLISLAGILAELAIAGIALFLWCVTPRGLVNSLCFVLSSVTIASTLLVNLNPAMRFDGYYVLMDVWGIDNLRPRAFAMTRWALRKWFLGLDAPPPEADVSPRRLAGLVLYSVYSWAYRFFLYLGIAVLVYLKFGKFLGALLFVAELYLFIARPVLSEADAIVRQRGRLRVNLRMLATMIVLSLVLLWAALPLPRRMALPAIVLPAEDSQLLFAPGDGTVSQLSVGRGSQVEADAVLLSVESEDLAAEIHMAETEHRRLNIELLRGLTELSERGRLRELRADLRALETRLEALRRQQAQNVLRARVDGVVTEWDTVLRDGLPVRQGMLLGRIEPSAGARLIAFVKEDYVAGLTPGDPVRYKPGGLSAARSGQIQSVSPVRQETLQNVSLAGFAQGELPTERTAGGQMVIRGSYYRVDIELAEDTSPPVRGRTGRVWINTRPRSLIAEAVRYAWRVLLRESGS